MSMSLRRWLNLARLSRGVPRTPVPANDLRVVAARNLRLSRRLSPAGSASSLAAGGVTPARRLSSASAGAGPCTPQINGRIK